MKPGFYGDVETRWLTVKEIADRGLEDSKSYAVLLNPLNYQPVSGPLITVPVGLITDFASVPRIFWSIFPPYDPYYGAPAVLHDFGYATTGTFLSKAPAMTRAQVDGLLLEAMTVQDTEKWRRTIIYDAVRVFGGPTWNAKHLAKHDWLNY